MSNEWDNYAEMWDSVASDYADNAFSELKKAIHLKGLRILDFGCGTGLLSERMAPFAKEIVALDNSVKMTEILKNKNLPDTTVVCDILTTDLISEQPALQNQFDLIVASSVCSFLPNYSETVELLYTLLKPEGLFIQWDWLTVEPGSKESFSKEEVQTVLHQIGFTEIKVSVPFEMSGPDGTMPVLMASGIKK